MSIILDEIRLDWIGFSHINIILHFVTREVKGAKGKQGNDNFFRDKSIMKEIDLSSYVPVHVS